MNIKIVVCKISVNSSNIFNLRKNPEELKSLVFKHISKNDKITYKNGEMSYAIQTLEFKQYIREGVVVGRIIKYKANMETEHWDDLNKQIVIKIDENNILEKVHFLYERNSELLVIEEKSKLDLVKIIEVFHHIINYNNMEIQIDINAQKHDKETKERIREFKKITSAHFELIPNNPDQKLWSLFENLSEKFTSTTSIHEFKNKDGLTYTEELEELVEDVNKGKSRMYIVGGYNAEDSYDEVRSHDYIKRYFRKTDSSDEGRIRGLWEVLKEVLDI